MSGMSFKVTDGRGFAYTKHSAPGLYVPALRVPLIRCGWCQRLNGDDRFAIHEFTPFGSSKSGKVCFVHGEEIEIRRLSPLFAQAQPEHQKTAKPWNVPNAGRSEAPRASGALFQAKKLMTRATRRRWSAEVTRHSNALDLQKSVFKQRSPRRIALSLKRSAEASRRRKGTPYQSAMSMLNFYINRAGRNLSGKQKRVLVRAKKALPKVFHRG